MSGKTDDDNACGICYEVREDLRMLPCWHVACINCILRMTQNGRGSAVCCHICREPCLFENIRSMPRPVHCTSCRNFVEDPRKLPCCSSLYCLKCLRSKETSKGSVRCINMCTVKKHNISNLSEAKMCLSCFHMHTQEPPSTSCRHSFCTNCQPKQESQVRKCPVCLALKAPIPVPVNPLELVAEPKESTAYQPKPRNLRSVEMISLLKTIRKKEEMKEWSAQVFGEQFLLEDAARELQRGSVFLIAVFIASIAFGLDFRTWITGIVVLPFLELSKYGNWLYTWVLECALWVLSLCTCFWEHMVWMAIDFIGRKAITFGTTKVCPKMEKSHTPIIIFEIAVIFITCWFFSEIFKHRLVVSLVVYYFRSEWSLQH